MDLIKAIQCLQKYVMNVVEKKQFETSLIILEHRTEVIAFVDTLQILSPTTQAGINMTSQNAVATAGEMTMKNVVVNTMHPYTSLRVTRQQQQHKVYLPIQQTMPYWQA
ncbi:uncharacterized protein LOC143044830 [Mytilus galloprovincialis]|uniref:uncharacterized protein LOC143044830 n=1 Tax=Mytilus galloprovincialis TaxID=29158 RepID=UPI003F7B651F